MNESTRPKKHVNPYHVIRPQPGYPISESDLLEEIDQSVTSPLATAHELLTADCVPRDSPQAERALETIGMAVRRLMQMYKGFFEKIPIGHLNDASPISYELEGKLSSLKGEGVDIEKELVAWLREAEAKTG